MSESKHTDGEWFSEGPDYFGDYSIISSEHQEAIAAVIAYERDAQEVAANAGLIRAAKAMYAALKEITLHYDPSMDMFGDSAECPVPVTLGELRRARAAVAKAEGRTP
ncbi:MAG: hypothetical protein LRY54_04145 [Alphaproteobacteria bacterium]|nr:hypothetical protein [Alphaproteobacteria bacterium]